MNRRSFLTAISTAIVAACAPAIAAARAWRPVLRREVLANGQRMYWLQVDAGDLKAGDLVRLTAHGSTLRAYVNGNLVGKWPE